MYFSLYAFGKLPTGIAFVKMGFYIQVECPTSDRYIRPVDQSKGTLSVNSNFFQQAKNLKFHFDEY